MLVSQENGQALDNAFLSPAATAADAAATQSVLDDIVSGFIQARIESAGPYRPMLIANRPGGMTMGEALHEEIATSDAFDISVAFVSAETLLSLFEDFRSHRTHREHIAADAEHTRDIVNATTPRSRLITSTKGYFNNPKAFWELLHVQRTTGVDVRIWEEPGAAEPDAARHSAATSDDPSGQPFHPKGYVFARRMRDGRPYYNLYVGSSNLTGTALNRQREWNLRVSSLADGELVRQFRQEIASQVEDSTPLTEEWIRQYEEDFKRYAPPRRQILERLQEQERRGIEPNAMQREALRNLKALRDKGEHRAIIVSATGTGKTYLSAFDVRACQPKRMLYIAQQQQILTAAMQSYQRVLGCDESELGLYSGTSKQQDRRYVFATVQTMSQPEALAQFAADAFDYVLVDEVHHAGAASYQRVIEHFSGADFMLGMTATPERTDGINIFQLFGYNIAYEIRLQKALDEDMLCPFHYYGVAEYLGTHDAAYTDNQGRTHTVGQRISVGGAGGADASAGTGDLSAGGNGDSGGSGLSAEQSGQLRYEIAQLATEERVRYIIGKLQEYGQYGVPVTGLVFCSRQEEARALSRLFNEQWNQQAERPYRTAAVTSTDEQGRAVTPSQREEYVRRLERGELDYLFTVDLFNEGVDIPAVNQIVMLRNTESSIVFTQQLGRGLRKFPHKDSVVVIDFIGNYANNYLIPVALYGNTGDRDIARKNLQRQSIGLSSISFDEIARERILGSLDTADWSDMKRLTEQYRQVRYELGRIPMLMDVYGYDPSLPYTLAAKSGNYLEFVRSRERSLSGRGRGRGGKSGRGGGNGETTFLDQLEPVDDTGNGMLKMATELLLPGLRPHELVILEQLCRFGDAHDAWDAQNPNAWNPSAPLRRSELIDAIQREFPHADCSDAQFDSAISVLDYTYFREGNRTRFGGEAMIERCESTETTETTTTTASHDDSADRRYRYRLSPRFAAMLDANRTFRAFFADTLRVGLANCHDLFRDAAAQHRPFDHAFLYERKYSLDDVMRLCGWRKENTPQNVGGYYLDADTNTMPIFVKYATSQYEDEFTNPQEMRYFSKNGRTPVSPEFRWLRALTDAYARGDGGDGAGTNGNGDGNAQTRFAPLFVMRKAESETADGKKLKGGKYYYVGHVVACQDPRLTTKPDATGSGSVKVTLSTLRLARPIDPELYRHLIG